MGTDYRTFFKGKYLTALDFEQDRTLVISRVDANDVEDPDKGVTKSKMVISFRGDVKDMVSSKTAADCIAKMYGDEVEGWVGKSVTFWNDKTVEVSGERKGGIRVRGAPGLGQKMSVKIKHPRKRAFYIDLIDTDPSQATPPLAEILKKAGLSADQVNTWLKSIGKNPHDSSNDKELADYLNNNPAGIRDILAAQPPADESPQYGD